MKQNELVLQQLIECAPSDNYDINTCSVLSNKANTNMRRALWNTAFALSFPPLPSGILVYRYQQSLAKIVELIEEEVPNENRIELIGRLLQELELNATLEHGSFVCFTVCSLL
jgi:hypothetical protein